MNVTVRVIGLTVNLNRPLTGLVTADNIGPLHRPSACDELAVGGTQFEIEIDRCRKKADLRFELCDRCGSAA